jgi:predicted nucleic acid-binding protein
MSERVIVVADSGPLIALSRIGHLELLPQLFGRVQIPNAVFREVTQGAAEGRSGAAEVRAAPWIDVVSADEATSATSARSPRRVARARDALLIIDDDRGYVRSSRGFLNVASTSRSA